MKNKKLLIPIFTGVLSVIGLTTFILIYGDDHKAAGPTSDELKPAIFKEIAESSSIQDEGYSISRVSASPEDVFEEKKIEKVNPITAYSGTKRLQPSEFYSTEIYGETFDILGLSGKDIKYGKHNGRYILQANECFQIELVKIADKYTPKIGVEEGDTTISTNYAILLEEYDEECKNKEAQDEIDIYDDTKDDGIFTFTPFYKFIKENKLEYDMSIYTPIDIKKILTKFFEIPEDYVYSASRMTNNKVFGRTGAYKSTKGDEKSNVEYYILYDKNGIYGVKLYYTDEAPLKDYGSENLNMPSVFDFVAPRCTDSDLYTSEISNYDKGESYKKRKNSVVSVKEYTFSDKDILS